MVYINLPHLSSLFICIIDWTLTAATSEFDDSVLYRLHWPGEALDKVAEESLTRDGQSVISITTGNNEQFVCSIPNQLDDGDNNFNDYMGPSPDQLLQPLYSQRSCTYRIEMYWTYELCHGRFIQQYHDEKDITSKTVKRQDYILGQYEPGTGPPGQRSDFDKNFDELKPPTRKMEENTVPYFPVLYSQGTVCDINDKPRRTVVMYMCDVNGKNQIESLTETSSCEYELIVLTPLLCSHPAFRPKEAIQHKIDCFPRTGSPQQPTSLTVWLREQMWEQQQQYNPLKHMFGALLDELSMMEAEEAAADDDEILRFEVFTTDEGDTIYQGFDKNGVVREATIETSEHKSNQPHESDNPDVDDQPQQQQQPQPPVQRQQQQQQPVIEADEMLMSSFLAGTYCLYGGAGWWKHEYCHSKQVLQYHEDPNTKHRTEVLLGVWHEEAHLAWISENPQKAPVVANGRVHQVTHLYTNGAYCEETGRKRRVEVRLRCRETQGSGNAVTLYMLEPKTCEYILGVESKMFCELLQTADVNGMFTKR